MRTLITLLLALSLCACACASARPRADRDDDEPGAISKGFTAIGMVLKGAGDGMAKGSQEQINCRSFDGGNTYNCNN